MTLRTSTSAAAIEEPAIQSSEAEPTTGELAAYCHTIVQELRRMLRKEPRQRDLQFLDYLFAMAEDESRRLKSDVFH